MHIAQLHKYFLIKLKYRLFTYNVHIMTSATDSPKHSLRGASRGEPKSPRSPLTSCGGAVRLAATNRPTLVIGSSIPPTSTPTSMPTSMSAMLVDAEVALHRARQRGATDAQVTPTPCQSTARPRLPRAARIVHGLSQDVDDNYRRCSAAPCAAWDPCVAAHLVPCYLVSMSLPLTCYALVRVAAALICCCCCCRGFLRICWHAILGPACLSVASEGIGRVPSYGHRARRG